MNLDHLGEALADLQASYARRPKDKDLARMIAHAKAEIADRQRAPALPNEPSDEL